MTHRAGGGLPPYPPTDAAGTLSDPLQPNPLRAQGPEGIREPFPRISSQSLRIFVAVRWLLGRRSSLGVFFARCKSSIGKGLYLPSDALRSPTIDANTRHPVVPSNHSNGFAPKPL